MDLSFWTKVHNSQRTWLQFASVEQASLQVCIRLGFAVSVTSTSHVSAPLLLGSGTLQQDIISTCSIYGVCLLFSLMFVCLADGRILCDPWSPERKTEWRPVKHSWSLINQINMSMLTMNSRESGRSMGGLECARFNRRNNSVNNSVCPLNQVHLATPFAERILMTTQFNAW